MTESRPALAASAVLAPVALALLVPSPGHAWQALTGPASADPLAPLLGLVALTVWALAAWLVAGVLLVMAGRLPGLAGACCRSLAARTVPATVRRAVGVALGTSLAMGTLGTLPASAAALDGSSRPTATSSATTSSATTSNAAAPNAAGPTLDWPTPTATPTPTPTPTPVPFPAPPGPVTVVQPGDTLWSLAERSLRADGTPDPSDAAVAATWPSWWAANREAVGDDPHLLRPGTRLVAPQDS